MRWEEEGKEARERGALSGNRLEDSVSFDLRKRGVMTHSSMIPAKMLIGFLVFF